jgi:class 3 adenylate cyclase
MKDKIKNALISSGIDNIYIDDLVGTILNPPKECIDKSELLNSDKTQLLLNILIIATYNLKKFNKVVVQLQEYILKNEHELSLFDEGRFLQIRGFLAWRLDGFLFSAYQLLNKSLKILDQLKTKESFQYIARVHDTYGQILRSQGLTNDAKQEYENSLVFREKANDICGKALTLGNLGRLNMELGDYAKARQYLLKDLDIVTKQTNEPAEIHAQLLNTLALCSIELDNLEEAGNFLKESYNINNSFNNSVGLCFNYLAYANLSLNKNELNVALKNLKNAQLISSKIDFPGFLKKTIDGETNQLFAEIFYKKGEIDKSLEYFSLALDCYHSSSAISPLVKAKLLHGFAKASLLKNDSEKSNMLFRESLRHLDGTEDNKLRKLIEKELRNQNKDSWLLHTAGRFIGHNQIDFLLDEAGMKGFRGEKQNVVILFSDIRDFTSISEKFEPDKSIAFLNNYLGLMTKCIELNEGFIDKFIGDAIMAIFSAPNSNITNFNNSAENASIAALLMQTELERYNRNLQKGFPKLKIGIGLHFGQVIAGLIGSPQKRSYTVIGDTVNTASRIEGMTKQLGANILITEDVYEKFIDKNKFLLRPLGKYKPKGRTKPINVAELIGVDDNSYLANEIKSEIYEVARYLKMFENRDFSNAYKGFNYLYEKNIKTHKAIGYKLLKETSFNFITNNPSENWNGEIELFSK